MLTNWLNTSTRWPPSRTSSSSSPNSSSLPEALAGSTPFELQQPQIAADLAQAQQRAQAPPCGSWPALGADGFEHFLAAGFEDLLIDRRAGLAVSSQ